MSREKEGKDKGSNNEKIALAIVAIACLAGAFYLLNSVMAPREVVVDGLKIRYASEPRQDMKAALSSSIIRIEERTTAENSTANSGIAMMGAEVAYAIASRGKQVYVYEIASDGQKYNCNENTSWCSNPQVIIGTDGCNCMTTGQKIEIYGGQEFMFNNSVIVRGLVGMALSG